jgi:hypothetical protein
LRDSARQVLSVAHAQPRFRRRGKQRPYPDCWATTTANHCADSGDWRSLFSARWYSSKTRCFVIPRRAPMSSNDIAGR